MALQDDINSFGTANTAADLLKLAAQTNSTDPNRSVAVATVNDLPDSSNNTIVPGTVLYVDSIQIPVISHTGCWTGLDNRILRKDFIFNPAWGWGRNIDGQLGNNNTVTRSSPVISVSFIGWCQIAAGSSHILGIRSNGTLWGWASNTFGQLGNNSTINRSSPVSAVGGITDWCQISAGGSHGLGIRTDGTAWSWGAGSGGRLGENATVNRSSPVSVVGGFTNWCQLAGGDQHSLGVRSDGTLWGWGSGACGRLGDNTTINKSSPVSVTGGFTWCRVSSGSQHNHGIKSDGTLWGWGSGACGRLGDNTTINKSSPVSVTGGFTDWCQVAAGCSHSIAVRTNGTAWSWGCNGLGRLGDNSLTNRSSPVSVVGGFTDWCQMAVGYNSSVGLRTNGTLWAWGCNKDGQVGNNTDVNYSSPVSVEGGFTDWCQVSSAVGGFHSVGIRTV